MDFKEFLNEKKLSFGEFQRAIKNKDAVVTVELSMGAVDVNDVEISSKNEIFGTTEDGSDVEFKFSDVIAVR